MIDESGISNRVQELLQRPVAGLGYELLEVQFRHEGRWMLRLVIDVPGGVTLEACGATSELAGRILEVEDPVGHEFSLEVTSPGLFRRLKELKHFEQSIGKIAKMRLAPDYLENRKNRTLRGEIGGVDGETVVINEIGGESIRLPHYALQSVRLDPDL